MTSKTFIEKAIEGGYNAESSIGYGVLKKYPDKFSFNTILLDHKSWEAVGRTEGWGKIETANCPACKATFIGTRFEEWQYKMHQMIDARINGKSIQEYLETL